MTLAVEPVKSITEPVVTVGVVGVDTEKLAVAPVLVSVMVRVAPADPHVSVAVAAVFEVIVGEPMLAPVPPLTDSVRAETDQIEFVPTKAIVPWQAVVHPPDPGVPVVGEIVKVSVATVIVLVRVSVVSVIVSVPVPEPVAITKVCDPAELFVELTRDVPVTPETVKLVLPVHEVALPTQLSVILPLWFAGTVAGVHAKLGVTANW
jgi:hypothetical protein